MNNYRHQVIIWMYHDGHKVIRCMRTVLFWVITQKVLAIRWMHNCGHKAVRWIHNYSHSNQMDASLWS
jgi:hypothetical protein